MKTLYKYSFILACVLYTSNLFAALEINCHFKEEQKSLLISHPLNPANLDYKQYLSVYKIVDDKNNVLAQDEFSQSLFFHDPNLTNTLVFIFVPKKNETPIFIALNHFQHQSLQEWTPGQYTVWSDIDFNYNPQTHENLKAKALPCNVEYSN